MFKAVFVKKALVIVCVSLAIISMLACSSSVDLGHTDCDLDRDQLDIAEGADSTDTKENSDNPSDGDLDFEQNEFAEDGDFEEIEISENSDASEHGDQEAVHLGIFDPTDRTKKFAPVASQACLDALALVDFSKTFDFIPAEVATQLHPALAFDGNGVWVALSLPNKTTSKFEIFAFHMACNGTTDIAPFRVTTNPLINSLDPDIAVNNNHMLVVWYGDDGAMSANLGIYMRAYNMDGTALSDVESKLLPARNGYAFSGNAWMVKIEPYTYERFVITGSWAAPYTTAWQSFAQIFDYNGAMLSYGMDANMNTSTSQLYPCISAKGDGSIHLAWSQSPLANLDLNRIAYTKIANDETTPNPYPPNIAYDEKAADMCDMAAETGDDGKVYLAFHSDGETNESTVVVTDGNNFDSYQPTLEFGVDGKYDHTPNVAAADSGGAVVWYRMISGIKADVWMYIYRNFRLAELSLITHRMQRK